LSASSKGPPNAIVFGCAGPKLAAEERRFFAAADPLGFILFARNCVDPAQLRALVADLRDAVGRADAPVLIDQEGGRVQRLGPPNWPKRPPAAAFAALAKRDEKAGGEAARLNARLMAADLHSVGIDVDCAPVIDLPVPGAHDVIGDRAHGDTPERVAALGRAVCEGLIVGGVQPVIKHIPGHGRARADSHIELPVVDTSLAELRRTDFRPFVALKEMPWAMTAHVLYRAIDEDGPVTSSRHGIDAIIRGEIGFDGILLSDDVSMEALKGTLAERARAVLAAGCDVALHCSGKLDEMRAIAADISPLSADAVRRIDRAAAVARMPEPADLPALERRLANLLMPATA
jgi:beta-N-acetylhexosaminidase